MRSIGSRSQTIFAKGRADQGSETRSHSRDLGLATNVTASLTFAVDGTITGADATFAAPPWAVGLDILVEGTNLNNGFFRTVAVDAADGAFVTVDPPPKAEGPLTATVRTA